MAIGSRMFRKRTSDSKHVAQQVWSVGSVGPAHLGVSTVELKSPSGKKKIKVAVRHFPLETGYVKAACE